MAGVPSTVSRQMMANLARVVAELTRMLHVNPVLALAWACSAALGCAPSTPSSADAGPDAVAAVQQDAAPAQTADTTANSTADVPTGGDTTTTAGLDAKNADAPTPAADTALAEDSAVSDQGPGTDALQLDAATPEVGPADSAAGPPDANSGDVLDTADAGPVLDTGPVLDIGPLLDAADSATADADSVGAGDASDGSAAADSGAISDSKGELDAQDGASAEIAGVSPSDVLDGVAAPDTGPNADAVAGEDVADSAPADGKNADGDGCSGDGCSTSSGQVAVYQETFPCAVPTAWTVEGGGWASALAQGATDDCAMVTTIDSATGSLTSPVIALPKTAVAMLYVKARCDVLDDAGSGFPASYETTYLVAGYCHLEVSADGFKSDVTSFAVPSLGPKTGTFSLAAYKGKSVQVRFSAADGASWSDGSFSVDEVTVATGGTAAAPACTNNADCDDGSVCTGEVCDLASGTCVGSLSVGDGKSCPSMSCDYSSDCAGSSCVAVPGKPGKGAVCGVTDCAKYTCIAVCLNGPYGYKPCEPNSTQSPQIICSGPDSAWPTKFG